ncbi:MAG: hypothetical protein ACSLE6_19100 [Mycobacterium sp.]
MLIGVAVLLVIAISVGATLLFTRDRGGTTQTATGNPPAAGEIASAGDTGPVTVITEDPTCISARPIFDTLTAKQRQGWTNRDYKIPARAWTADQRDMYRTAGDAMLRAADQLAALALVTPHRVMRELYTQAIAYWHAYVQTFDNYEERDNHLVLTASNAASALITLCTTIDYKVAAARAPLVDPGKNPATQPITGDPEMNNDMFISVDGNPICREWVESIDQFDVASKEWRATDLSVPSSQWSDDQRAIVATVSPLISEHADKVELLGRDSGNPVFEDIATLSAQYWRAIVEAFPSYSSADSYLSATASHADFMIRNACKAVGS